MLKDRPDILLVEDDADHGELIYRWMRKQGQRMHVRWARSGREALACLAEKQYDLLLLDYYLPDMSAFTLLDKAYPDGVPQPFIVITGAGSERLRLRALNRGAMKVIFKTGKSLGDIASILEQTLREVEKRPAFENSRLYYDLLENANDAIYFHDKRGKFIYLNRKAEELTGYTRDELLDKPVNKILLEDGKKILRERLSRGRIWRWDRKFELNIKTKQNRIVPVELTMSPIVRDKKLLGFEGVARDMRERRKAQHLLDEREARIHKLNVEIQKKNLKLEEGSRVQSEFVSNISHEFRTPINGIIGYTDLLLEQVYGTLTDEQVSALKNIKGCAVSLLNMVQEILDLSKLKSNRLRLEKELCAPRDLIEATADIIHPIALQKGLQVEKRFDDALPPVNVDFRRIYQVFVNLAGNAVKFTSQGKVTIGAHQEGNAIRFFVRDTGIGVNPEIKEKIFQEFRQGDSSKTRDFGGIGLGLSLSKRLIEMHDGKIGVESQRNRGSTFYFTIPLAEAEVHVGN